MRFRLSPLAWSVLSCALALRPFAALGAEFSPARETVHNETAQVTTPVAPFASRPVASWQEAQIALARLGFSSGSIDGIAGAQTERALRAFQRREKLPDTGLLDPATCAALLLTTNAIAEIQFSVEDLAAVQPLSPTWLGKSEQRSLGFESALEWAAERGRAHPNLIRELNPSLDWDSILPGTYMRLPAISQVNFVAKAARLHILLEAHVLEARDAAGMVLAHFPVSIAQRLEKRPAGELRVTVVIPDPDYTFDPATFPESAEARGLSRKLQLPPGPNNPVGVAWIGLDLPGYGIHGTPTPEKIGRTESHGCFRLANWDAQSLIELSWVGMPVIIEP